MRVQRTCIAIAGTASIGTKAWGSRPADQARVSLSGILNQIRFSLLEAPDLF